jgi:hypothetical protein
VWLTAHSGSPAVRPLFQHWLIDGTRRDQFLDRIIFNLSLKY